MSLFSFKKHHKRLPFDVGYINHRSVLLLLTLFDIIYFTIHGSINAILLTLYKAFDALFKFL